MESISSIIESEIFTGEELFDMGDIGPCELIEGRIVPMSPTGGEHGLIELNLAHELKKFVSQRKLGWVLTGEVGIYTRHNPDTVRGADIVFMSKKRLATIPSRGFLKVAPELVVEILSPADSRKEMQRKINEYLEIGVNRVWVVEPEEQSLMVYQSKAKPLKLTGHDKLIGEDILAGFELEIVKIFTDE